MENVAVFPEATEAFEELHLMHPDISDTAMAILERFVVLLYNRTSDIMNVNDSRKYLFTQKSRSLENLPPTQAALKEHIKRTSYQSNCWNKALLSKQELPSPADWGWRKDTTGWEPLWTTISEASQACYKLIKCAWMQERVHWTMQVCKGCPKVYCSLLLLWRMPAIDLWDSYLLQQIFYHINSKTIVTHHVK